MQDEAQNDDVRAIRLLITRQFASLSWGPAKSPDWAGLQSDFHDNAVLYGASRPATSQSPEAFAARMKALAETSLRSFDEAVLGTEVRVFGNVAVAVAACESTENGTQIDRNVEMMLLLKEDGRWKIVAQAWDRADEAQPIPEGLLAGKAELA
ncbi:DUF4440 domain-containing protein [Bosea caraganae]|uniref:DUF4440 domain-containing protein n=1 Tax=Bosea caraganae TaxID=2763117 RepID=A0A370KXW9_9HYPH|nr:DUF4440 domain-containing protein [Bosea caraganae]RDJ19845.1 DUF4440 domain-containing protein [Bosea caraganae]RDJ25575.1 DUF4440 domain-containing protein [Bosea caraganae]